ncbi:IDLC protein, partial [Bucco capensis]|nr:IDLC protein [Bucco capensis]
MIPPPDTLLRYQPPVLVSRRTEKRSPGVPPLKGTPPHPAPTGPVPPVAAAASGKQPQELLNAILPPREWEEENRRWVQEVSSAPSTRLDVVQLQEQLDLRLQQRQARETGICPVRRELYAQCFDELIRQSTIGCAERGLLLLRVRDELQLTLAAYQSLYESSTAYGIRKALQAEQGKAAMQQRVNLEEEKKELERQVSEQKAKCEAIETREKERRQIEEKKHTEELQFLKKMNQQLK